MQIPGKSARTTFVEERILTDSHDADPTGGPLKKKILIRDIPRKTPILLADLFSSRLKALEEENGSPKNGGIGKAEPRK